jgi:hypothetical protein
MLLSLPRPLRAQNDSAPPDSPLPAKAQGSKLVTSGFVDVYYSKNFQSPASQTNRLRNFDIAENQIALSLAELVVQQKSEPVGFRIDADFGTTSDAVHGITPMAPATSTLAWVQQAYLSAVLPIGDGLTLDAGKFVTAMGLEVIESKDNWNYSRSLLFAWAVPYYHTGVRLSYPLSSNLSASVHVVNGWNSVTDNNAFKSLGLMLSYAPTARTALIVNAMNGVEQPAAAIFGKRTVVDVIFTQALSENVSLALNADYGEEPTAAGLATWKGAALGARIAFDPATALALRGEVFADPVGFATGSGIPHATFSEVTVTLERRVLDALLVRAEFRDDFANTPFFDKKDAVGTEQSQPTFLLGLVVSF